jgi:hypothetical protein
MSGQTETAKSREKKKMTEQVFQMVEAARLKNNSKGSTNKRRLPEKNGKVVGLLCFQRVLFNNRENQVFFKDRII